MNIKTWQQRLEEQYSRTAPHDGGERAAMLDEIAELRAAASRAMLPVTDSYERQWITSAANAVESYGNSELAAKLRSIASPVAGWVSVEKPVHTIRGHVTDIGQLDDLHGAHGVVIEREGQCSVTIKMGVEDVRALASLAFDDIVVSFAPAPVTPKQEQS